MKHARVDWGAPRAARRPRTGGHVAAFALALGMSVALGAGCGGTPEAERSWREVEGWSPTADAPARWPGFPLLPDGRFPITAWCSPPVWEMNDERFAEYAEAGFTLVLPALEDPYRAEANLERLRLAEKHGLYAFVRDHLVHPDEAYQPEWRDSVDRMVELYGDHPALLGYFLADEPRPAVFPSLAAITDRFAARDPVHPTFCNLLPVSWKGYGPDGFAYNRYVGEFLERVRPALFSYDLYTLEVEADKPHFYAAMDTIRLEGTRLGVPYWAILQITPHREFRDLTAAELRWQGMHALAYGAKGIGWFTYWTPKADPEGYRDGPITYDGERTAAYDRVAAVNRLVQSVGRELAEAEIADVRHTDPLPPGGVRLDEASWLGAEGAAVTIGFFRGAQPIGGGGVAEIGGPGSGVGSGRILIVNRSYRDPVSVLVESSRPLQRFDPVTRTYGPVAEIDGEEGVGRLVSLSPGGAALFAH